MEFPGARVPPPLVITWPVIVPVPLRIPPAFTVVFEVSDPLTASVPALTVVVPV